VYGYIILEFYTTYIDHIKRNGKPNLKIKNKKMSTIRYNSHTHTRTDNTGIPC